MLIKFKTEGPIALSRRCLGTTGHFEKAGENFPPKGTAQFFHKQGAYFVKDRSHNRGWLLVKEHGTLVTTQIVQRYYDNSGKNEERGIPSDVNRFT